MNFITNSECDISHLSRAELADIIVDAWVRRGTEWVGISEANGKGGIYSIYITRLAYSTPQRVLPICSQLRIFGITRARLSPALPDADALAYHYT